MADASGAGWASTVVIGSLTGIALSADRLPARVASHFGADGLAAGYLAREVYVQVMIGAAVLLPALLALSIGVLVRRGPALVALPDRAYWLAPARRTATAAWLTVHAAWLAAGASAGALGVHLLVVRANHLAPPRLEAVPSLVLLLAFGAGLLAWFGALRRRFRAR